MYTYQHFEFSFVTFCNFSQYIWVFNSHYHILTQISQSWAKHAFYIIFSLCWQFVPIMLALCSMLLPPYYAQNYAGTIGSSLYLASYSCIILITQDDYLIHVKGTLIAPFYRPLQQLRSYTPLLLAIKSFISRLKANCSHACMHVLAYLSACMLVWWN